MIQIDELTMEYLDVVLDEICRLLPHVRNHRLGKAIDQEPLASALQVA